MTTTEQAAIDEGSAAATRTVTALESTVENAATYRLSNGIVLEFTHVPPQAVRRAMSAVKEPEVPTFHNDQKDRDEPNPMDPDYLRDLQTWIAATAEAGQAVAFMLGVKVVSVPEDMLDVDDGEWIEEVEEVWKITCPDDDLTVPVSSPKERLLSWLRYYAITSDIDTYITTSICMQRIGLTEEEVQAAVASFRSAEVRSADTVAIAAAGSVDRDHVPPATPEPDPGD